MTADFEKTAESSLVRSRFDQSNAVLYGTSEHNLAKLQRAQNALARVVMFTKRMYIRPIQQKLYWLLLTTTE